MDQEFAFEARRVASRWQLTEILDWMAHHGSSVLLNWGEDNKAWECSWITGGSRFTGFDANPCQAAIHAIENCLEKKESDE